MATVPSSRSGAGGKILSNRRKQRLVTTPYDRPPPSGPPPKSSNWVTGVIIPSARALASGAGKILSSAIFSDSESSSSGDEHSASEDDVNNVNEYENPYDGVNTLNEKKVTSLEMTQHGQESQFSMQRTETKRVIEQLIVQETFSREERDRLINALNSRVMSTEAVEERSLANFPEKTVDHDVDTFNKAVLEAKKWFQEKKVGSGSLIELAHGACNLNSTGLEQIESGLGSPADVARSYMRDRPPWASPTKHVEVRTPLTTAKKLFKEGTSYSVSRDTLSSSKRRKSLSSGSWNIREELRRVRSKATEDMLRTPPAKIDPSLFAVAPTRQESAGAGKVVFGMGERTAEPDSFGKTKPIEALMYIGVISDPALVALESRQDGKACEATSANPAVSVSGNNEDSEAIQIVGQCAPSEFPHPTSPNRAGDHHSDRHSCKISGPPATEVAEFGGRQYVNGYSSSQASLSAGVSTVQNCDQYDEENRNADGASEKQSTSTTNVEGNCELLSEAENRNADSAASEKKSTNTTNVEGNCELLSEAYMEVKIVTETDSMASGSQSSLGLQYEELSLEMTPQSTKENADIKTGKQQGRKLGKNNRRSIGRGKQGNNS